MQAQNRFALKEWAIVEKALSEGRQILLLRKGGLIENRKEFSVEHPEFFLYPTYLHQQRQGVVPAAMEDLERILASAPPENWVMLSHYAVVQDIQRITDLKRLRNLDGRHLFTDGEMEKRFFYGKHPGLHLLLLRVYRLPEPVRRPVLPRYAGCRSWVELDEDVPTAGCRPVLDDAAFHRERAAVMALVKQPT